MSRHACEFCGREEMLPFKCNYCGGVFCRDHHLPENHDCSFEKVIEYYEEGSEERNQRVGRTKGKHRKKAILITVLIAVLGIVYWTDFLTLLVDWSSPTIQIISPKTKLYNTNTVDLTYVINKPALWTSYILDGQATVTISGNTTVEGLADGTHNLTIHANNIISVASSETVHFAIDTRPPVIKIISPTMGTYGTTSSHCTIDLTYTVLSTKWVWRSSSIGGFAPEVASWMGYSLNGLKNNTLTGNVTLSFAPNRYDLVVYANDTAGNMGSSSVSFTATRIFNSLNNLKKYLITDDLSDVEWTPDYVCHHFALDFIQRAEMKGYYCFTYYALYGTELDEFDNAVESIKTSRGSYIVGSGSGHAVVRTTVDGLDVIVDPQTDIIMAYPDFGVLYEGEILQGW